MIVVFLSVMVGIGVWGMKRTSNVGDFFLGGRTLGPWISAIAYGTSYFSAVLFIGFAGKLGWGFGLNVLWIALGNSLGGALLAWLVLGRRTRIMTQNLDVMTMPEFLEGRYRSAGIKTLSAVIIFIFLLPYSASVFKGLGYLFMANFGISYDLALFIMIGITGIYLVLGGYFAIAVTDFVQGIVMFVGALFMVGILTDKAGGFGAAIETIRANYAVHVPVEKQPGWLLLGSLVFMTSFGTWGLPQMVQKFYAIKSESMIRRAAIVTMVFSLVITFAAYWTGALAHVFFDKPIMGANGKPAFDMLIPTLLTNHLPGPLMALILLLVLSASMSTLSSLVLVSASAIAIDLHKGRVSPEVSKETTLKLLRVLSAVFIVISFIIARHEFAIIVTLMSLSWGVVAGSFMAPYFYGLYWRRTTRVGAWAGLLTGMTLGIVLFYVLGPDRSPIATTIAMLVPFLVVPAVSMATTPPETEHLERAFKGI
jgi:SSS family solute:Na+ symporter